MKKLLYLPFVLILISSCASVESIKKNENCVVWKDQKIWGPYSIEVIEKKVEWSGSCKGNNRDCDVVLISLDENNNVFSGTDLLGKIENNELHFAKKQALSEILNFTGVRVYPELKILKSSITMNAVTTEENYQYNDKCTSEEAIVGAISLGLISNSQSKKRK
jgi:hypothetical protein